MAEPWRTGQHLKPLQQEKAESPTDASLSGQRKGNIKAIPEEEREYPLPRVKTKTEVATIKLTPACRLAWEAAAAAEKRSLANMFEVAILAYCKHHQISVTAVADELPVDGLHTLGAKL